MFTIFLALQPQCYEKFALQSEKLTMPGNNAVSDLEEIEEIESFALECIGVLGNLTNSDIDYNMIINEYKLWPTLAQGLHPDSKTPDDLILEMVILLGTFCIDDECAVSLCKKGLINLLIELLKQKQEDDELVCQIVQIINKLITHNRTRKQVVENSQAAAYIVDLMHDSNEQIRRVCDETLELISEASPAWADKIKNENFKWHNQQWLQMVENQQLDANFDNLDLHDHYADQIEFFEQNGYDNDMYWGELDNQVPQY